MAIDIDKLNEAELIDLNHRIVERLRFMQQARAHMSMLQFRIGERVTFQPTGREPITGVVTRYNKKSVTVVTADGGRWNVAPTFLRAAPLDVEVQGKPSGAAESSLHLPHSQRAAHEAGT